MMTLAVFVAAVIVSIVLKHQDQRSRMAIESVYDRLGRELPDPKPPIPKIEAIFDIVLGLCFFAFGVVAFLAYLAVAETDVEISGQYYVAIFLTVGIAMITKGVRVLREWKWISMENREPGMEK